MDDVCTTDECAFRSSARKECTSHISEMNIIYIYSINAQLSKSPNGNLDLSAIVISFATCDIVNLTNSIRR